MTSPAASGVTDPTQGTALRAAKLALRRAVLDRRNALDPGIRAAASAAIQAQVAVLPEFMAARAMLVTLPYQTEWDTLPLVRAALAAGKTVALPRVNTTTRMLELHAIADPQRDVAASPRGIPEPLPDRTRVPREAIDFVLVPGVAFDLAGRRLGYGGGYYDRLLPLLAPAAARVAGALEVQLVDLVPAAAHDLPVDTLVTESRLLRLR